MYHFTLNMVVNHTCKVIEFEKELINYHHYNLFYDVFMVSKDEIRCSILIHIPFSSTQKGDTYSIYVCVRHLAYTAQPSWCAGMGQVFTFAPLR